MSEISENEIKSMTKEQNYMRGYEDGKSDVLDKITEEIEKYKADCGKPEDIGYFSEVNQRTKGAYETCLRIINYWRNEVNE
jgi:hypothetical protein